MFARLIRGKIAGIRVGFVVLMMSHVHPLSNANGKSGRSSARRISGYDIYRHWSIWRAR